MKSTKKSTKRCKHRWHVTKITGDVLKSMWDLEVHDQCDKCEQTLVRQATWEEAEEQRIKRTEEITCQRCGFPHLEVTKDCVICLAEQVRKLTERLNAASVNI